jgi:hypothetical protein
MPLPRISDKARLVNAMLDAAERLGDAEMLRALWDYKRSIATPPSSFGAGGFRLVRSR